MFNMKKILMIIILFLIFLPISLKAYEIDNLLSKHVIVYNLDENEMIYEKNSDEITSIASLTKIMTTIVAIENIEDLKEKVLITYEMLEGIPWDASIAYLEVGDEVTYEDLLYAVMLPSGADATQALAISLTGSIQNFVNKMNEKAKELNMLNTNFVNTTGLDADGHYSTALDILKLLKYSLENETFKKVYQTKEYNTSNGLYFRSTLKYINEKLEYYYNFDYVLGSKTGNTDNAGVCLSTLSKIKGRNIITITINAPIEYRTANHLKDLNIISEAINKDFDIIKIVEKDEILVKLKTKYAKEENIIIKAPKDINKFLNIPYNKDKLKIKYNGKEVINYNIKKGTKLGEVFIYYDDELLDKFDYTLKEQLHFSIINFMEININYVIFIGIIFLISIIIILKKLFKKRSK